MAAFCNSTSFIQRIFASGSGRSNVIEIKANDIRQASFEKDLPEIDDPILFLKLGMRLNENELVEVAEFGHAETINLSFLDLQFFI